MYSVAYTQGIAIVEKEKNTTLELSMFPENEQLFPRNLETNLGKIPISGTASVVHRYQEVRVKLYREGQWQQNFSYPLDYQGIHAHFEFNIPIPAELVNYKIELYGVRASGEEVWEATANELVAGDVYIINGQSNAQANVAPHPDDNNPFARSYELDRGWTNKQFSTPGQWGARLARRIIEEQGIPVAIFNQAVGGQRIDFYLRNETDPLADNYGKLFRRLQAAGIQKEVRAGFWFQGESDGWVREENFTNTYKNKLRQLQLAWQQDYEIEHFYFYQIRYRSCSHLYPSVMEAQRELQNDFGDLSIMSTTNAAHDSCHYYYDNGYAVLGDRMYNLMASRLYNTSDYNVAAPDIRRAYLATPRHIAVELRDVQGDLRVQGNVWQDFQVEGSEAEVVSGWTDGQRVFLELSAEPAGATGISYLSHIGDTPPWITNDQGVGLLTFYNFPIEDIPDAIADLEVEIQAASDSYERYRNFEYEVVLHNRSDITATNVEVEVPVPTGVAFAGATLGSGQYLSWENRWLIPSLRAGGSTTLKLNLFPLIATDPIVAYAQVIDADQNDPDSTPDNGTQSFPLEDDEARLIFMPRSAQTGMEEVDIALTLSADTEEYKIYKNVTYQLNVQNKGQATATNIEVDISLSDEFAFTSSRASHGNYDNWNTIWRIPELEIGEIATLIVTMFTLTDEIPLEFIAELMELDQRDINASNNQSTWTIMPARGRPSTNFSEISSPYVLHAYPNPVQSSLTIRTYLPTEQIADFYLQDTQGSILKTWKQSLTKGTNTISVDCSDVVDGMYFLVLRTDSTTDAIYKIVKQ